jgi:hypothetical protein
MLSSIKYLFIVIGLFCAACTFDTRKNADTKNAGNVVASDTATVVYQCPMKCQGDTAYVNAGSCPVCGMDLEKTTRK